MGNTNKNILIVDDDIDLSMLICDMLEDNGYQVHHITNVEETYEYLEKNTPELILLDINLPDGNGLEICKELRRISNVPIIFASARTSEDDRITGFDIGGDDYLPKPYSIKELLSRINALFRRTYGEKNLEKITLHAGKNNTVTIDEGSRRVERNGNVIVLSPKEYELLIYLVKFKGHALAKDDIISKVWGAFSMVEQSTLTVHARWLREKLENNPSKPIFIKTVWGVGYMLEETDE